ncbi:transposase [Streptomyces mirabilis]|uniref:transposase n=1 Tax=Streptomyces mirabilis TaxID=68239 RepID=UPI0036829C43
MARGDLTDEQWGVLEPLLPKGKKPGRPLLWTRRQLIDGIRFRVLRQGRRDRLEPARRTGDVRAVPAHPPVRPGLREHPDASGHPR